MSRPSSVSSSSGLSMAQDYGLKAMRLKALESAGRNVQRRMPDDALAAHAPRGHPAVDLPAAR